MPITQYNLINPDRTERLFSGTSPPKRLKSLRSSPDEIPRGVAPDEGGGSPRRGLSTGSGLTALHQASGLVHDEVARDGGYPEIPGIRGLRSPRSLETDLPCLRVKPC